MTVKSIEILFCKLYTEDINNKRKTGRVKRQLPFKNILKFNDISNLNYKNPDFPFSPFVVIVVVVVYISLLYIKSNNLSLSRI